MTFSRAFRSLSLTAVLAVLVLSGCRTYGGYGSEEEAYEQIAEANRQFTEQLTRAQAELAQLVDGPAARAHEDYVARFAALVEGHEAVLAEQLDLQESLEGSGDYRKLHNALGAIVSNQEIVQNRYEELYFELVQSLDSTAVYDEVLLSRYAFVPPFYQAIMADLKTQRVAQRADALLTGQAPAQTPPDTTALQPLGS